jgi:outer membrane protein assembly factor BamB
MLKLAGATGAEIWRTEVDDGATDQTLLPAFRLDASGDFALCAGGFDGSSGAALKFAGTSGVEVWRFVDPLLSDCSDVEIDPSGNVFAAFDATVLRLDVSGTEVWRHTAPPYIYDLAWTAAGTCSPPG